MSNGVARLPDNTRLAGSIKSVGEMLAWLYKELSDEIPICELFKLASLTPARIIGIDKTHGSLEVGKTADIAIFDRELRTRAVIKNQERMF